MDSAGTDGVGLGYTRLWGYSMITGSAKTKPENAASPDRSHKPSDEVNRESAVREIRMLRLTRRELETDPRGTAPVLDPTCGSVGVRFPCATRLGTSVIFVFLAKR